MGIYPNFIEHKPQNLRMDWIHFTNANWQANGTAPTGKVYFRPTMKDPEGNILAGNMVIMTVLAVEFLFNTPESVAENSKELNEIYFNELAEKDFYFKTKPRPDGHEDYLLMTSTLFLKTHTFTKIDIEEWIKVFLQIQGIPCDSLTEATYNEFADENPMMRMFSKAEIGRAHV